MRAFAASLLSLLLVQCESGARSTSEGEIPTEHSGSNCSVDSTLIELLPFEASLGLEAYEADTTQEVTLAEIEVAECLLINDLEHPEHGDSELRNRLTTQRYFRQYCALKNSRGDRHLYMNAYCHGENDTAGVKHWVKVYDGGSCYFHALFNLTSKEIVYYVVNGEA